MILSNTFIKKAESIDALSIANIEKECFSMPWSLQSVEEALKNDTSLFIVAKKDDKVVGYISSTFVLDEVYISNIAVSPMARQEGIATKLIEKLIEIALKKDMSFISLEVRPSNLTAIKLYKKLGFENLGRRKNFYQAPTEDAFIMTKYFKR